MGVLIWCAVLGAGVWLYSRRYLNVELDPQVRSGLTGLRLILLAILGWWVVAQPTYRDTVSVEEPARVVALLDDSRSMSFPVDSPVDNDPSGSVSRWQAVRDFLTAQRLERFADDEIELETRLLSTPQVVFATGTSGLMRAFQLTPSTAQTDLDSAAGVLASAASSRPVQILLFSDGRQTTPGGLIDNVGQAAGHARYWTFGVGPEELPLNASLTRLQGNGRLRSGSRSEYVLRGRRHASQRESLAIRMELVRQQPSESEALAAGDVVWATDVVVPGLADDAPGKNEFTIPFFVDGPEETGRYVLGATVTLSGDRIPQDDSINKEIEAVPSSDPVLIVTGQPTWELRFLKRALEDDPTLDVLAGWFHEGSMIWLMDRMWVAERRGEQELPQSLPGPEIWENLSQYSLIVLHRLALETLEPSIREKITAALENGSRALVLLGDSPAGNSKIEPLGIGHLGTLDTTYLPYVGNDLNSGALQTSLEALLQPPPPPLQGIYVTGLLPPGSRTLLAMRENEAEPERPVITEVSIGLGKAVVSFTDSIWRWELHDQRGSKLWRLLVHQVLRPEHVVPDRLIVEPPAPEVGDAILLRFDADLQSAEGPPRSMPIHVQTPMGLKPLTLVASKDTPNRLEAQMVASVSGTYRAMALSRGAEIEFQVTLPDRESIDITQDRAALERLARRSKGAYAPPNEWEDLLEKVDTKPYRYEVERPRPWVSRWWIVLLVSALLCAEWLWRQRENLP